MDLAGVGTFVTSPPLGRVLQQAYLTEQHPQMLPHHPGMLWESSASPGSQPCLSWGAEPWRQPTCDAWRRNSLLAAFNSGDDPLTGSPPALADTEGPGDCSLLQDCTWIFCWTVSYQIKKMPWVGTRTHTTVPSERPKHQSPEPCSPLPETSHFCNVTEDRRVRSSQCPEVPPASRTGALRGRGYPAVRASAPVYFLCRYRHPATPSTKGVPSFSFMKAEYLPFYFPVS